MSFRTVCRNRHGFVLIGLLFLIAGLGVVMAAAGTLWDTVAKRERERELLFIGDQYRRAIESYHQAEPYGQARQYPKKLGDLILDRRYPNTVRHLRRFYPDPISGSPEWGIVKASDGGIAGVFSLSQGRPKKQAGFPSRYAGFEGRNTYSDWLFLVGDEAGVTSRTTLAAESAAATDMRDDSPADRTVVDVGANKPDLPPSPLPEEPRPDHQDRSDRINHCQTLVERGFNACSSAAHGDAGYLNTCLEEVQRRHRDCLQDI